MPGRPLKLLIMLISPLHSTVNTVLFRGGKGVQVPSAGVLKAGDEIWAGGCSPADTDTHLAKILHS